MDLEWTLTLSEIAEGEAAQALAQGLRAQQESSAIAAPPEPMTARSNP